APPSDIKYEASDRLVSSRAAARQQPMVSRRCWRAIRRMVSDTSPNPVSCTNSAIDDTSEDACGSRFMMSSRGPLSAATAPRAAGPGGDSWGAAPAINPPLALRKVRRHPCFPPTGSPPAPWMSAYAAARVVLSSLIVHLRIVVSVFLPSRLL